MGMSNDLEVAVNCGATIVRVGTDIFGSREIRGRSKMTNVSFIGAGNMAYSIIRGLLDSPTKDSS